jgi:hypothetical protein
VSNEDDDVLFIVLDDDKDDGDDDGDEAGLKVGSSDALIKGLSLASWNSILGLSSESQTESEVDFEKSRA